MDIIKKTMKDAERLLKAIHANYYIELPTGEEISHGLDGYELVPAAEEPKPERKKRANRTGLPFGSLVSYYRPFLDKAQKAGDVVTIPFGTYPPEYLRGAVCAYCTQFWGKGSYKSVMNREKAQIEILRLKNAAPKEDKAARQDIKANGHGTPTHPSKFKTVGHGMDALGNLRFDDPDLQRQ